jgi:hypothetical protein
LPDSTAKPKQKATDSAPKTDDSVLESRLKLKKKFSSGSKPKKAEVEAEESSDSDKVEEGKKEVKEGRVWHTISAKVDKKSMEKFDVSTEKDTGVDL